LLVIEVGFELRMKQFGFLILVATLLIGCSSQVGVGVGYRVYDPYYTDYHVWGPDEVVFYNRWEGEHHREHRDFRRLDRGEQRQYWQWRHSEAGRR
jgi:hypothetical protein